MGGILWLTADSNFLSANLLAFYAYINFDPNLKVLLCLFSRTSSSEAVYGLGARHPFKHSDKRFQSI